MNTTMASPFSILPAQGRRWDCLALGEVMLRLDPGEGRIRNARELRVWEGGGEYNVARGLRKTFGHRTGVLTALPRNDIGLLAEDLILQGGVDTDNILWREYDGIGRNTRMGLNFTERGYGVRAALGVSDRANSAAAQIRPDEFDWDRLFGPNGARWLHTGGIFATLSPSTAQTTLQAMRTARRHGVIVSHDLNYRTSLWGSHADPESARQANREIVAHCDLLVGDAFSFEASLGLTVDSSRQHAAAMDQTAADAACAQVFARFQNLGAIAFPLRDPHSASCNSWGGVLHMRGQRYASRRYAALDVLDRVGGGDAFVAGLIHGFLEGADPQRALDLAVAHGALAMTTPGDNAMVSKEEVEAVADGESAIARR